MLSVHKKLLSWFLSFRFFFLALFNQYARRSLKLKHRSFKVLKVQLFSCFIVVLIIFNKKRKTANNNSVYYSLILTFVSMLLLHDSNS